MSSNLKELQLYLTNRELNTYEFNNDNDDPRKYFDLESSYRI